MRLLKALGLALAGIVVEVVAVRVRFLGLGSELQLVLAHRLELLLVVVEDVVPPGPTFAQEQECALVHAVRDAVTGNV